MIGGSRAGEDVTPDAAAEELPGDVDQPAAATDGKRSEEESNRSLLSRAALKDYLCLGPIVAKTIYYYISLSFIAFSVSQPLYGEALRGSLASLIAAGAFAAGGRLPLWAVLLAPIPHLMLTDPFFYWAGRRYGRGFVKFLERNDPRWHRRAARAEKFFRRWGLWAILFAYFVPVPSDLLYFGAGDARIPFWRFILVDFVGTIMYTSLWVALGFIIGDPARRFADGVGKYGLYITIAVIVAIILYSVVTAWRGHRGARTSGGP